LGPEEDQGVSPIGPTSHEQQPEIPVRRAELGPARLPFEHHELMAQRQNFQGEILSRSEERKRIDQNEPENGQHGPLSLIANHRHSIISQRDGFSATHRGHRSAQSLPRLAVKAPAVSPAYKLATLRPPATNSSTSRTDSRDTRQRQPSGTTDR